MLILLPPSEGKSAPRRGRPLDLGGLVLPELTAQRQRLLDTLVSLCSHDPGHATGVLRLGPTQADDVARNAALRAAPTAAARAVYSGVLFDALGLDDLPAAAARRSTRSVLLFSALFGVLRPTDRIPAYRLSGTVRLPGVGPTTRFWRAPLQQALADRIDGHLVVDLRSGTYLPMWAPDRSRQATTVRVRVVRDANAHRVAVSHHNKVTKGRLARTLLVAREQPRTRSDLMDLLHDLGWQPAPGPTADVVDVLEQPV
jgi:cytoplasmic iron level regulating protein YaaA (DUF328/UPF0246 family)